MSLVKANERGEKIESHRYPMDFHCFRFRGMARLHWTKMANFSFFFIHPYSLLVSTQYGADSLEGRARHPTSGRRPPAGPEPANRTVKKKKKTKQKAPKKNSPRKKERKREIKWRQKWQNQTTKKKKKTDRLSAVLTAFYTKKKREKGKKKEKKRERKRNARLPSCTGLQRNRYVGYSWLFFFGR